MLEIVAGSWPLAFMFAFAMLAFVFSYLIFKVSQRRERELEYRATTSREVVHRDNAG